MLVFEHAHLPVHQPAGPVVVGERRVQPAEPVHQRARLLLGQRGVGIDPRQLAAGAEIAQAQHPLDRVVAEDRRHRSCQVSDSADQGVPLVLDSGTVGRRGNLRKSLDPGLALLDDDAAPIRPYPQDQVHVAVAGRAALADQLTRPQPALALEVVRECVAVGQVRITGARYRRDERVSSAFHLDRHAGTQRSRQPGGEPARDPRCPPPTAS